MKLHTKFYPNLSINKQGMILNCVIKEYDWGLQMGIFLGPKNPHKPHF